jgi:hypothetical protein
VLHLELAMLEAKLKTWRAAAALTLYASCMVASILLVFRLGNGNGSNREDEVGSQGCRLPAILMQLPMPS